MGVEVPSAGFTTFNLWSPRTHGHRMRGERIKGVSKAYQYRIGRVSVLYQSRIGYDITLVSVSFDHCIISVSDL